MRYVEKERQSQTLVSACIGFMCILYAQLYNQVLGVRGHDQSENFVLCLFIKLEEQARHV